MLRNSGGRTHPSSKKAAVQLREGLRHRARTPPTFSVAVFERFVKTDQTTEVDLDSSKNFG